jgi:hypothetical protein
MKKIGKYKSATVSVVLFLISSIVFLYTLMFLIKQFCLFFERICSIETLAIGGFVYIIFEIFIFWLSFLVYKRLK